MKPFKGVAFLCLTTICLAPSLSFCLEESKSALDDDCIQVQIERKARKTLERHESQVKRASMRATVERPYSWNDITLAPHRVIKPGEPVRVLSIDGGGVRGVIPSVFLRHLEERTGRHIADLFDLIIGTSTGGIIAVALTTPDESGLKPKYSAEDMVEFYREDAERIFTAKACCGSFFGLCGPSYKAEPLENLLYEKVMDQPLAFSFSNVAVTTVNTETNRLEILASYKAKVREKANYYKRDACRATSAAPTYFNPMTMTPIGHPREVKSAIDGGLGANNPAMCGVIETIKIFGEGHPIHLLSLGTGEAPSYINPQSVSRRGILGWVKPVIQTTFDSQSFSTHYQLQQMLTETNWGSYYRFQAALSPEQIPMDRSDPPHIRSLEVAAERMIEEKKYEIRELLEQFWHISPTHALVAAQAGVDAATSPMPPASTSEI